MYLISNRQYDEVVEMLTDYIKRSDMATSLRECTRYRRARLLVKALSKRLPIDNEKITLLTTKNK